MKKLSSLALILGIILSSQGCIKNIRNRFKIWKNLENSQIGIDYRFSEKGHAIRQMIAYYPGDCLMDKGDKCFIKAKKSFCLYYTDINNNKKRDKGDKILRIGYRVNPINQCVDPKKGMILINKRGIIYNIKKPERKPNPQNL